MATYQYPTEDYARPARLDVQPINNNFAFESQYSGDIQTVGQPGGRLRMTMAYPQQAFSERRKLEAYLMQLNGMEHRSANFDVAHPQPAGTILTSGVTMSAASQYATSVTLNGCGAGTTLLQGDWIGVTHSAGQQMLRVIADATANGSGVMVVTVRMPLRAAVTGGATVTIIRPRALFVLASPTLTFPREDSGRCPAFSVEWIEVFA